MAFKNVKFNLYWRRFLSLGKRVIDSAVIEVQQPKDKTDRCYNVITCLTWQRCTNILCLVVIFMHSSFVFSLHLIMKQWQRGQRTTMGNRCWGEEKRLKFSVFYKFDVLVCVLLQFVRCTIARTLALAVLQPLQRFICMWKPQIKISIPPPGADTLSSDQLEYQHRHYHSVHHVHQIHYFL